MENNRGLASVYSREIVEINDSQGSFANAFFKTMIFDDQVSGHHLEYLHHLYVRACELPNFRFIFAVPEKFKRVSDKMIWQKASNIDFCFFDETKIHSSFSRARLLGKLAKANHADKVFCITLMSFLPWLPLFVPSGIMVSGIVYLIYLYRWKKSSWSLRIQDILKYVIFSKFKVFDKIFLLNDAGAAGFFNRKFHTNKFKYLPDPIAVRDFESARDLRSELKIGDTEQVLLHFGGMSGRKGTLEVLQSIEILPQKGYVFIFAGVVGSDIKNEFYARVARLRERGANILVFDEFCSYSFLCDLCKTCDAIVIPYKSTEQSSGVIAYAAALNRPVLAPRSGLLGKIIRKYRLGCLLKEVSATQIAEAIQNRFWQNLKLNGAEYLRDNELCLFQKIILEE